MTLAFDLGFSSKREYEKYKNKFRKLPYLTGVIFKEGAKEHLFVIRETLEIGMRKNNLGYSSLSPMTKRIRQSTNSSSVPISPLVGKGVLIRNLEIVSSSNGSFDLKPNNKFSVKGRSRISFKRLWMIQEWGAIIPVTEKMRGYFSAVFRIFLRQSTVQLVIPARRPMQRAYNRYLRSERKKEINEAMKKRLKAAMRPT